MKTIITFPATSDRMRGGLRLALCLAAFLFCWVAPLFVEYQPWASGRLSRMSAAFDFRLRYHESECLKRGYDPFQVWNGASPIPGYVSYDINDAQANLERAWASGEKMLHVYPPWVMACWVPVTWFSEVTGFAVYTAVEILLVALLMLLLKRRVERRLGSETAGLLAVSFGGFALPAVLNCLHLGNFGIVIAFGIVVCLLLIERGFPLLAGVPLFLCMLKPQIGLLYLITLLVLGKWKPVLVCSLLMLLLSAAASYLCGSSILEMVLSITKYNGSVGFPASGFITPALHAYLYRHMPGLPLAVGIGLCGLCSVILSRRFAANKDLLIAFLPAVMISTVWAAGGWLHDHSIDAVGYVLLAYAMLAGNRSCATVIWSWLVLMFSMMREIGRTPYPMPNVAVVLMMLGLLGLSASLKGVLVPEERQ